MKAFSDENQKRYLDLRELPTIKRLVGVLVSCFYTNEKSQQSFRIFRKL